MGETLRSLEKKKKKKKKKKNVGNKKLSKNMPGMPAATTTIVSQLDALLSSSCYQPITTMTAGDGVSTLTSAAMFDSDGFGPDVTDAPNNGPHPHQHPHQHQHPQYQHPQHEHQHPQPHPSQYQHHTPVSASADSFPSHRLAAASSSARPMATSFDQWHAAHGRPTAVGSSSAGRVGRVGRGAPGATKDEEEERWAGFLTRVQRQEKEKQRWVRATARPFLLQPVSSPALSLLFPLYCGNGTHMRGHYTRTHTGPYESWSAKKLPWRRRSASSRPASP